MLEAIWVFLGLIVVSGLMYALATYVFGRSEDLAPMPPDATPMVLPETRSLNGNDIRRVRLPVSVRGYRMSDVDILLDRVADELDQTTDRAPIAPDGAGQRVVEPAADPSQPAADDRSDRRADVTKPPDRVMGQEPDEDREPRHWEVPGPTGQEPDHDWEPRRWDVPDPADQEPDQAQAPRTEQGSERESPPVDRPPRSTGQPGSES